MQGAADLISSQFTRFALVGMIGFVADTVILLSVVRFLGLLPLPARIVSFVCAASLTYVLNRHFTFEYPANAPTRWLRYLLTTSIGALINIGAFQMWISVSGADSLQLAIGTMIGSLLALSFNYIASRKFIFVQRR